MATRERCPKCKSYNITGRGFDVAGGDELQERYCYDCGNAEERMRSAGGVSWYVAAPPQEPHRSHAATGIEHTLLSEIYDTPDDDGPRSIYADWLIERGDPRGTFIALQLARARRRDPIASDEEQALLDEHWSAWIGHPSAAIDNYLVEFERGFWSACDRFVIGEKVIAQVPEVLTERSWGTVRRLSLPSVDGYCAQILAAVERSLRSLTITSREAFVRIARFDQPLAIEELVLAFDVSRDPPELVFPSLPRLRALGVHCLGEYAARWSERADAAGLREISLVTRAHPDDVSEVIRSAKKLRLARITFAIGAITLHVERDSDGSLAVRSIALAEIDEALENARSWIERLGAHVDRGVKLTTEVFTPELAQAADALGLHLVRSSTTFGTRPSVRVRVGRR